MKLKSILACLVLCVAVSGIARGQKVSVDWDRAASFSGFKTYAWVAGTPVPNQLMHQRIVDGIDQQLSLKGLQKVDVSANPDLIVSYVAAMSSQTQVNTMGTGGWGWGYRRGGGMTTTTVSTIPVGLLEVNIGNPSHKLLWIGKSSDAISDNPEKSAKRINKALEKMFKKFPPPVK